MKESLSCRKPDAGKQLTKPKTFHSRPAVGVDGKGETAIYSLCAEDGVINICRLRPNAYGQLERKILIEGGRNSSFESIPAFRSKIEVVGGVVPERDYAALKECGVTGVYPPGTNIPTAALEVLGLIAPFILPNEERIQEGLDLVLNKQDKNGRWPCEKHPKGGQWMDKYIGLEEIGKPSKWVTLNALRMLKDLYEKQVD